MERKHPPHVNTFDDHDDDGGGSGDDSSTQKHKDRLYALQKFGLEAVEGNSQNMKDCLGYIHTCYRTVLWMYRILFAVGVVTACFAIVKGLFASNAAQAVPSLVFAGLSAASFYSLTIIRPLESLERNTIFSSWIIGITNTYWTRIASIDNLQNQQEQLKEANDDLANGLSSLADKYARVTGKHIDLQNASSSASSGSSKTDKDSNSKY